MHIHQRKKRLPKSIQVEDVTPRIMRKRQLQAKYPHIPPHCIYVDPINDVVLFKNQETNGWVSRAETVLYQYEKGD